MASRADDDASSVQGSSVMDDASELVSDDDEDNVSQASSDSNDEESLENESSTTTSSRRPRRAEIDPSTMSEAEREDLSGRILRQVEFYFGDAHYPKDHILRALAGGDPDGFVDIMIVMSFKKMRRLCNFIEFVAFALLGSSIVTVDSSKRRVKRTHPVPKDLEEALTRTVLVENLMPSATIESIHAHFVQHALVSQVRVLGRGESVPGNLMYYLSCLTH